MGVQIWKEVQVSRSSHLCIAQKYSSENQPPKLNKVKGRGDAYPLSKQYPWQRLKNQLYLQT